MDETGCRIDVAMNQYVCTARGKTNIVLPSFNNCELVALVECVSITGESIEPMSCSDCLRFSNTECGSCLTDMLCSVMTSATPAMSSSSSECNTLTSLQKTTLSAYGDCCLLTVMARI